MRLASVSFGLITLFWGFIQAPFFHFHAEDLDHDHGAGITHTHDYGFHVDTAPEIEAHTADDDAVDVLWSISAPALFHYELPLLISEFIVPATQVSQTPVAPEISLHSHDPPSFSPRNPRPPPA
ncbi:MAG: hypothetical protein ABL995_15235 [Bryobacteraceae bacterium]